MQHLVTVRVVQSVGDGGDDPHHLGGGNAFRILVAQQPGGVGAVDEFHRDPQLAFEVPPVVDGDDVRVAQCGDHLGLQVETLAVFLVAADRGTEHFECIVAG